MSHLWAGVKKSLFRGYCAYFQRFPVDRGKHFCGRIMNCVFSAGVYEKEGLRLELHPADMLGRKLISGEEHDVEVHELIRERLANGGTFIDIGAHMGYFSLLAARNAHVRIFAFEPSPRELARLYRHILLNNAFTICVFPFGLADRNAILPLRYAAAHNTGMNSIVTLDTDSPGTIDRPFVRFDSLLATDVLEDVRLVKIDVEGFEVEVLRGMEKSIPKMKQAYFVVEISPGYLAKGGHHQTEVYEFFERFGLRPRYGDRERVQYNEVFYP